MQRHVPICCDELDWMQMRPLVENADTLLKWSKRVFGKTIVNGIVKHTFFHQFCAGKALRNLPSPTQEHPGFQVCSRKLTSVMLPYVHSLSKGVSSHHLCDGAPVLQVLLVSRAAGPVMDCISRGQKGMDCGFPSHCLASASLNRNGM